VKPFYPRPDDIVELSVKVIEDVNDNGGNRRLSMTTRNHDPLFVARPFENEFRKGADGDARLLRFEQFRVVYLCMHAEDNLVDIRRNLLRKPTFFIGQ